MTKTLALADSFGVTLLALAVASPVGCGTHAPARENLQPFVAVSGYYGLLDAQAGPTPAPEPKPSGCVEGCKCNGTGKEKSGDGLAMVNCRCPDDCACKAKGAAKQCPNGTCPLPTRSIVR